MSRRKATPKLRGPRSSAAAPHAATPRLAAARDASGRVHLILQRDRHGARVSLTTSAPLFAEAWQNDVAVSAAGTAYQSLSKGVDRARVVALVRHAMDSTSKLAEGFLARAELGQVACRAGCDHCCHQSVGVTPAEAVAIADHLEQTRTESELASLTTALERARTETAGSSREERYSPEHPCPFLSAGHCTIYEVRPLSCRGMNSLDAEDCQRTLRDPEARTAYLERGAGGRAFMEPIRAFHAVSAGIQLGLFELFGLDMQPLDLTAAVHELLTNPAASERWLAGDSPFAAARGGDASDDPTLGALAGTLAAPPSK